MNARTHWHVAAICLCTLATTGVTAAATESDENSVVRLDKRTPVDPNSPNKQFLKPIGIVIDRHSRKTATGTLISNCHVLTNRHAVGGIRVSNDASTAEVEEDLTIDVVGHEVEFQIGYDARNPIKLRSTVRGIVVATGQGGDADDWAIVRLERNIGRRYGKASVSGSKFPAAETLITAGYPGDKFYLRDSADQLVRDARMWEEQGPAVEDRGYWTADLNVMPGQSGSPVFVKREGRYAVIGLLRAEFPLPASAPSKDNEMQTTRGTAQIVPLEKAADRLSAALQQAPCDE